MTKADHQLLNGSDKMELLKAAQNLPLKPDLKNDLSSKFSSCCKSTSLRAAELCSDCGPKSRRSSSPDIKPGMIEVTPSRSEVSTIPMTEQEHDLKATKVKIECQGQINKNQNLQSKDGFSKLRLFVLLLSLLQLVQVMGSG